MSFDPLASPVDYVLLAGRRSPGLAEITGASSPRKWDERAGYALSGARVVFRGIGLARPVLTLRLYSEQDWEDWHAWKELVTKPPPMERPRAIDIWHPILEDLGISSVVVEDVAQPVQSSPDGEWSIVIKFIEWRAPQMALASPDASQARPFDPVEAEIAMNDAVIRQLNQELAR